MLIGARGRALTSLTMWLLDSHRFKMSPDGINLPRSKVIREIVLAFNIACDLVLIY